MSATVLPTVSLGKVLLLAAPAVAALADVEAQLKAAGSDVSVQAPSTAGSAGPDESFDAVVFVADAGSASESIRDGGALPAARKLLKLGGKVLVVIAGLASEARAAAKAVTTDLTFAGFVGAAEGATQTVGSDKALVSVTAAAPAFKAGAAAKFVPRSKVAAAASAGSGAGAATTGPVDRVVTWDAASGSSSAAAGDLIDEESLLEGDAATGAAGKAKEGAGGCAPKRKACRNCTCGRKEEEDAAPKAVTIEPTATAAEIKLPAPPANKSACGNCYKGDAFRCGGCPFLGKPAFQPGSEGAVLLDMSSADM